MRLFPAIFANLILLIAAMGFGNALKRFFPQRFSALDRCAFTLVGGLGVLGTVLFCIGQIWFSRPIIFAILLVGAIFGLKPNLQTVRGFRLSRPRNRSILPMAIVAFVLIVTAIGGLALPTGDMNNDSIAYHFLGPKVWLRNHIIRPVPDEIFTAFPAVVETQYAALMSLGGQRAPEFFAVISFLSLLLIAASLALRLGVDASSVWWLAALLVTMPAVYRGATGGFIDVLYAAFVLAAARIVFDLEKTGGFVLFGFFGGFAMAAKYTGLIACALLLLFAVFLFYFRRNKARLPFPSLGISCAVALGIAAPFYLRNWMVLGSPIIPPPPILSRFLHVRYLPAESIAQFHAYILDRGKGLGRGVFAFLLLPFNLTFHTSNFHGAGGIGLAPLALGPMGVMVSWRNECAKWLALFAFALTVVWFFTQQESRFLIHVYVIAVLFAVLGWEFLTRGAPRYTRALAASVVTVSILYGLIMIVPDKLPEMHAALSSSFEAQRRLREIPFAESFNFLNNDPSVTKILIPNPYVAGYYSDKPYLKPVGRLGEQTISDATDLPKILSELQSLQISHVLDVDTAPNGFLLPAHPAGMTLLFQSEGQRVYRVD